MKEDIQSEKRERMRIRRLLKRQSVNEIRVSPGYQSHEQRWPIVRKLPTDFEPYGPVRSASYTDPGSASLKSPDDSTSAEPQYAASLPLSPRRNRWDF